MPKRGTIYSHRVRFVYPNGIGATSVARDRDHADFQAEDLLRRGASVEIISVDPITRAQTVLRSLTPADLPAAEDGEDGEVIEATSTDLAVIPAAELSADRTVSQSTRDRIERSVPENTKRAYGRQLARFEAWCAEQGRTAYPCTAETLAEFVNMLCDLDLGRSSIDQAITAVRAQHRNLGYQHQPDTTAARKVLKTHSKDQAEAGRRVGKAPVITIERLRLMIEHTDVTTLAGLRDAALLVLGFTLMARRSELAALNITDVRETEDGLLILIRSSKTDQSGIGAEVAIPRGSHSATDPVRVLRRYLKALAERGVTGGRLLRSVDRHGRLGESISEDGINRAVRAGAERAGLDQAADFSAHGLRAGGATSAYRAGSPVSAIASQGRWSDKSTAVLGYIRAVDQWNDNPMRNVGL